MASLKLESLSLQNFATFKSHSINFKSGLNAIVGETGSGKSLILDAIELVFGGRADKKSVRHGSESATIEAVLSFSSDHIKDELEDLGFPAEENSVVIKRIIKKDGTSRCWLNHMSCNLSQIVAFSRQHIDLVGQFENQKLMSESYQLALLDQFGSTTALAKEVKDYFQQIQRHKSERELLERSQEQIEQKVDYLNYQLNEINQLNPQVGDEEKLVALKSDHLNVNKKQTFLAQLKDMIHGSDSSDGVSSLVKSLRSHLFKNSSLIPSELLSRFNDLECSLEVFSDTVENISLADLDPEQFQLVIDRLDLYSKLKRKFGGTVESILEAKSTFEADLSRIVNSEKEIAALTAKIKNTEKLLHQCAEDLHVKRIDTAKKLSAALTLAVRDLRMIGAELLFELTKTDSFCDAGFTKLQFLAQTNPGEGFFKVKEIASGGELSRILLAVRQVLSSHDSVSIFLFDEIDTGMGGETALHIGRSLAKVASASQVVTITHLPQIAAFADNLIVVSKETSLDSGSDRTVSIVKELHDKKGIKKEIEAMIPLH
jgi:DNA repair protein RecN (Recombination protein N)